MASVLRVIIGYRLMFVDPVFAIMLAGAVRIKTAIFPRSWIPGLYRESLFRRVLMEKSIVAPRLRCVHYSQDNIKA